mmetsp:Transcript_3655/g.5269  ORF Transcript_3655/g.5269 Transcript_3655/m.5269 type:complete len:112 (-) Transcript_3655:76-411(-)
MMSKPPVENTNGAPMNVPSQEAITYECSILRQRRIMRRRIKLRLRSLCKDERQRKSIPRMAAKLEVVLFNGAISLEEYTDLSTLNSRLQMISNCLKTFKKPQSQGRLKPQE